MTTAAEIRPFVATGETKRVLARRLGIAERIVRVHVTSIVRM
ncbi:hypothetical protein [Streptomyces mutabilis]